MIGWIVGGIGVFVLAFVFVLALCKSAARGDEIMEAWWKERHG